MKSVFFVCSGNTCRSPLAEGLAKKYLQDKQNKNIDIQSRGLFVTALKAKEETIKVAKKLNIDLSNHIAKPITEQDLKIATAIFVMESFHKSYIEGLFPKYKQKVFTLYKYALNKDKDVQDPYNLGLLKYEQCLEELQFLINKIDFEKI